MRYPISSPPNSQPQFTPGRHGIECIADQIDHHLPQLTRMAIDVGCRLIVSRNFNSQCSASVLVQRERIIKDGSNGEPYWFSLAAVETNSLGRNLGDARQLTLGGCQVLFPVLRQFFVFQQE